MVVRSKSVKDENIITDEDLILHPDSPIPLYHQIKLHIRQKVDKGTWKPDHMIPSENKFAKAYGVSPGTVRKAIDALVNESVLYRKQGKGTFVAHPNFPGYIRFFRFPDHEDGVTRTSVEIMSVKRESPNDDVKKILNLADGDQVIILKRLRPNQNFPIVMEDIYLPAKNFPNFDLADFTDDPVYQTYNEKYKVPIVDAHDYYAVKNADKKVSESLKNKRGDPVIFIERISFTYDDLPVEYRKCYGRGDMFQIHIPLGKAWRNHLDDLYWHRWSLGLK